MEENRQDRVIPNDAAGYCSRGDACLDAKDYDQAIADYTKALRLMPSSYICRYHLKSAQNAKAGK